MKKVIVIGSGFGGLGAAIRLATQGHDVQLFEKRDRLGGRAYQYEINGFKFDGGPTVITAPYMFEELFENAGKKWRITWTLIPLDPFYRIFNEDTKSFDYRHKTEDMLAEIERWNPADKAGYLKFVDEDGGDLHQIPAVHRETLPETVGHAQIMPDMFKRLRCNPRMAWSPNTSRTNSCAACSPSTRC
jgi:phytoene dehydrogenase-like protein